MPYKDKAKQKQSVKNRQNKIRRSMYDFKETNPCVDCKNYFHYCQMDFDHLENKKFNISERSASGFSNLVLEELAKCELVCANCHRLRGFNRLNGKVAEKD